MNEKEKFPTPSQFYRNIRPEFFSDSKIESKVLLTKEQLAFEISQISTNQKHDSFENLCRRLAEKLITPNLIPQVGPTGGGDGKTDSETYPVSNYISDRWFISENKWNKNENWAFAISAKKDWKPKVKSDVKKIVETKRGYTKTYFFSNQKIRSKDKKETQDLINEIHGIELIILDAEWIIEKVYSNHLLNEVIDSLNLSSLHREEKKLGANDLKRTEKLSKIEKTINSSDRTFEVDFQLVEDCLESAILSRMLELPKTEVIGKFERAKRFVNKLSNVQQKIRIHYQLAWTLINWYDDYKSFYEEFLIVKELVQNHPNLNNIEFYLNLSNILKTISRIEYVRDILVIDIEKEENDFLTFITKCANNKEKISTSLLAKFHLSFFQLRRKIENGVSVSDELIKLKEYFRLSEKHLDIPFEQLKELINVYDKILPDNEDYDDLILVIAELESTRVSELSSGKIYLNRGSTKLKNNLNKESLIFFGKAVRKLAKEETQNEFYFCLMLLSEAYSNLGLYWAANNCIISAINLYINEFFTTGIINLRLYKSIEQILKNEVILGRIPILLTWYELFNVIKYYFESELNSENDEMPIENLIDGCLSTRLLNTSFENFKELSDLSDILAKNGLWLSADSVLYLLGHEDSIEVNETKSPSYTKENFKEFYNKLANQPFVNQMAFESNFLNKNEITSYTRILGIKFIINSKDDIHLLILGETIFAYLESFLATAFEDAFPLSEKIILNIKYDKLNKFFEIRHESKNLFDLFIKQDYICKPEDISKLMNELISLIIGRNYLFKDYKAFFENLYKNDEVHERLALIIEHEKFLINILTSEPKFFLKNWIKENNKNFPLQRTSNPIEISISDLKKDVTDKGKPDFNSATHKNMRAETIIDTYLWDKAKWKAFGLVVALPQPNPFGIMLTFEDEEAGKKIFKNWIKEYGKIDKEEIISISIIKGIRKDKPYWYKVLVSKNIKKNEIKDGSFVSLSSRFHRMEPTNSNNLDNLINGYNHLNKYLLIPAHIDKDFNIKPFPELGILKTKLKFINAWEIGIDEPERIVITEDDDPIIPHNIENAPILELLKEKNKRE
ncbi:hypothetical protein [Aureispira sp. CCB-E]|uniref:hypothetical protein n=1 Tax=Aureispira sp. CCB-E TaxID=3051121 RepID=UPI00286853E6|nr:hypothetical protein [Aureispira sp. CCB-E]WMX16552.1 hypothetical protein QP953_09250 [Aureispira sp. CCB-E]